MTSWHSLVTALFFSAFALGCTADAEGSGDADSQGSGGTHSEGSTTRAGARAGSGGEPDGVTAAGGNHGATADAAGAADGAAGASSSSAAVDPSSDSADAGTLAASESDSIYDHAVPRADSFWTAGGRLYHGDRELRLFGLNWFGLDGETLALHGPPHSGRSVPDFLDQIQELGFNALRVPLSPESIRPGFPTADWAIRGDLDTGRDHLDELLEAATAAGLYLLLDVHTCAASAGYRAGAPDDESCGGYSVDDWLDDLDTLAGLAEDYAPRIIGIDLFNEPHSLDWATWRALAERGGEAVLRRNPRILVFVEGIGAAGYTGSTSPFWGENLMGAESDPPALPPSRLVYSPHVYGPSVYEQSYFADPDFPDNMPAIWDEHFGFLFARGAAVVPGELGGTYRGTDAIWQDAFVDYLVDRGARGFFYWCLNPDSADTEGLLLDDWRTVNQDKLTLLERLMGP